MRNLTWREGKKESENKGEILLVREKRREERKRVLRFASSLIRSELPPALEVRCDIVVDGVVVIVTVNASEPQNLRNKSRKIDRRRRRASKRQENCSPDLHPANIVIFIASSSANKSNWRKKNSILGSRGCCCCCGIRVQKRRNLSKHLRNSWRRSGSSFNK